jgi:hypothetical protein
VSSSNVSARNAETLNFCTALNFGSGSALAGASGPNVVAWQHIVWQNAVAENSAVASVVIRSFLRFLGQCK